MKLHDYLTQQRGRTADLARAIKAHYPDVARWAAGTRVIPIRFGIPIERATGGLVTRQELFSADICRDVWPELSTTPAEETP
ncbi:hypothetical protein ASF61_16895 [Duganella sp. Leaf126]|uniref:transcriptional regulator n=1 Tax=Duganella sp. Leaf126 TaxID=1736266 RepID=UPI000701A1A3|nr:YdaS family helix-turn-helix protein [Duganella sp. Leaf126]KQQ32011.1 hypothetical protein ASF61_16895 [Duganella sp. Leaf126]